MDGALVGIMLLGAGRTLLTPQQSLMHSALSWQVPSFGIDLPASLMHLIYDSTLPAVMGCGHDLVQRATRRRRRRALPKVHARRR